MTVSVGTMQLTLFIVITQVQVPTYICCNCAGFETVSIAITQLEISATFTQLNVFATNILVTIFIEIMHVEGIFSSALCA